ncbi:Hypothetical_protein [Hexamita inflata]|uniref:Hypothetical_protein n=1 Tax=Hexamita inflata TaxID=28002 RepID=A0AA86RSI0_9EUKA|nr:Hypothetical protein HINF_LOCUS64839 [Hexamita inflata]
MSQTTLQITLAPIKIMPNGREYNIEYQKNTLLMYQDGKQFDEIRAYKREQTQGISNKTIYLFLEIYHIPKRIKKSGKILLPVCLSFNKATDKVFSYVINTQYTR